MRRTRGFTLVELLVVIAIIGLLASIVLANLGTARNRGRDAAVEQDLHAVMQQAELIRASTQQCYPGSSGTCIAAAQTLTTTATCGTNTSLLCSNGVILQAMQGAQSTAAGFITMQNPAGATAYAFAVQFATSKTLAWCVDSSGQSKSETMTANSQAALNAVITNKSTCN